MEKLASAIFFVGIVVYLSFNLNGARGEGIDLLKSDQTVGKTKILDQFVKLGQPKTLDEFENMEQPQTNDETKTLDQLENIEGLNNEDHSQILGGKYEDDSVDEIKAIQRHVVYQDVARDTLLKFSAELRKRKNAKNNVTNAFLKVIAGFEKEIAEFHAALRRRSVKSGAIRRLQNFIKKAAKDQKTNAKILRALTSHGLFLAQLHGSVAKRTVDILHLGARTFLKDIEKDVGKTVFEDFLSINGLVTLIFVIDDTGSMSDDIAAVRAISEQIIKARSKTSNVVDVDFILSPFNDPDTGPITRMGKNEGAEFLRATKALRAHSVKSNRDCPEMAFTGMKEALLEGPQQGSSMYVFTDAAPKDATKDNNNKVREYAAFYEVKINFFIRESCDPSIAFQPYRDLATDTNGILYTLKNAFELKKLGKTLITPGMTVTTPLISKDWGWVSGRRRRSTNVNYSIPVDDSIEKMSLVVTAQNSGNGISLIDPKGNTVIVGSLPLDKGMVYDIERPITGAYTLIVPASAGDHKLRVNGVSEINVDFGHYYVAVARRGSRIPVPLDQPLQGFPAKAFIAVAGGESVNPGSLRIKVVDEKGTVYADKPLIAVGTSGVRYFVRFDPPSGPFKLQLHGQTRKGNPFVRESSRKDQTVPVLLKLSYSEDSNTLHRGQTTSITVIILRGGAGSYRQKYTLSLKDGRGYGRVTLKPRPVYRGRKGFARIKFDVPADAPAGKTENVKISLTRDGEKSPVASLIFSVLLV